MADQTGGGWNEMGLPESLYVTHKRDILISVKARVEVRIYQ